jgi:hypothetical protein
MDFFGKTRIIISTIIIVLAGSGLHFLYDLSGQQPWVGLISAINESTWEHTKLAFITMLIFWLIFSFKKRKNFRHQAKAATAGIFAAISSIIFIPLFFYTYTAGLGIHSIAWDIGNFSLSVLIGQCIGAYIYNRTSPSAVAGVFAIIAFILLFVLYAFWTFNPPSIPLFISPV